MTTTATTTDTQPPTKMRISQLNTYPIKSLRGCSPSSLTVTPTGLAYDRHFMLIRTSDGANMHIGKLFEMCLFTTELSPAESPQKVIIRYGKTHTFNKPDEKVDDEPLEVDLRPDYQNMEKVEMEMHSSGTVGYAVGKRCDEWFSRRFGYDVRLLYLGDSKRKVLGNLSPNVAQGKGDDEKGKDGGNGWLNWTASTATSILGMVSGADGKENSSTGGPSGVYKGVDTGISFADCAPFLVVSSKSFEDASHRLEGGELDISKFRANIVIDGADEEFEEDYWAELHISGKNGDSRIVLTSNCARCASINVDYNTGKPDEGAPGTILKKLQKDRRVDQGSKWSPIFGRYGFLAQKPGDEGVTEARLEVGDTVTVVKRNAERTRFQWPKLSTDN